MHPEHNPSVPTSQPTHVACDPYSDPPPEGPNVLQAMQQRQVLARAHPKHPIPAFGCRSGPPKTVWYRPGATRTREGETSLEILRAAEWVAVRRGMFWTSNDQTAVDALRARCFDYQYIERRRIETRPTWLETLCRNQWAVEDAPGFPTKAGFLRFLTDLLHARRAGAIGAILSQTDAGTLYDVTPRHWRRWMEHAEATGMVRILQLWQRDPTHRRHRGHWRMCYMLGHSIVERAGVAIYEGLDRKSGNGRDMKPAAAAAARRLRAARNQANRERHDDLWHQGCASSVREARKFPSSLSPDMVSGPTLQSRETGDSLPCVSPNGEIEIARAKVADGNQSSRVQDGGKEIQPAGAPLASLTRSGAQPTAIPVESAKDTVRGADRLGSALNASTTKTSSSGSISAMLANYTEKLRLSLTAFLFFFVSSVVGCREIPDVYAGAGLGTSENDDLTGLSSVWTTSGTAASTQGVTLGTAASTHDPPESELTGSSSDESWITDDTGDPETSSDGGTMATWEDILLRSACVAHCFTAEDIERNWCDSQTFADPASDVPFCMYLARDAVLFRCGEACTCSVGCGE